MKVGTSNSERTKKKEVEIRKSKEDNSKDRVIKDRYPEGSDGGSIVGQWYNRTSDKFRVCKKTRV